MFDNFTMMDFGTAMAAKVATANTIGLDLIATGAAMRVLGFYLHKQKVDVLDDDLKGLCEGLKNKSKSTQYAYPAAMKALSKRLIKDKGIPTAKTPSQFWQDVAGSDFATGIALVVAYIKTDLDCLSVRDLALELSGNTQKKKTEKTTVEKVQALLDKAEDATMLEIIMALIVANGQSDNVSAALVAREEALARHAA